MSGIQPSGYLHLGNYFGMMSKMIEYQDKNDLYCFIADFHALTTNLTQRFYQQTYIMLFVIYCTRLSPDKTTFWVQSDVPEVTELAWILSSYTTLGLMDRSTTYKDKIAKGIAEYGLILIPFNGESILLFTAM